MSFPLYNTLLQRKTKKSLTKDARTRLVENIGALDQDGQHHVLALILYYQKENNIDQLSIAPVMDISLTSLPADLQVLLEIFCSLHLQVMAENLSRFNK